MCTYLRGSISFVEKGLNAQAAGAAGVIIYNNTAGTINMVSDPAIKSLHVNNAIKRCGNGSSIDSWKSS
ncbi:hypothetical protein JQK62_24620 [Leptospira santarosai]|nr:hypothetical protein [Leptospira santarosai]